MTDFEVLVAVAFDLEVLVAAASDLVVLAVAVIVPVFVVVDFFDKLHHNSYTVIVAVFHLHRKLCHNWNM
jgi:hypothetical protein